MTTTTTFIDSSECARIKDGMQGEFAEIVNKELCGADNVVGMLRWLNEGESLDASLEDPRYQLIYLMEGSGVIELEGKDYEVAAGNGVYLEPSETANIKQAGGEQLKLFHLVVPKQNA
jgi:quercetin dioxygenase-like cupin family protein